MKTYEVMYHFIDGNQDNKALVTLFFLYFDSTPEKFRTVDNLSQKQDIFTCESINFIQLL